MKEHRGRKPMIGLQETINKLVQDGKSYQDIANILRLGSRQIARYHFLRYRKKAGDNSTLDKIIVKD